MVCLSVGLSVTLASPAKTAEPIDMLFGLRTWVAPRHHVLDGGSDPPMERGKFWGRMGAPLQSIDISSICGGDAVNIVCNNCAQCNAQTYEQT